MKFADGFDTDKEKETCQEGYKVVSVPTKFNNKIVAICINDKGSALRIYTEDGGFYTMPITKNCNKDICKLTQNKNEEKCDERMDYEDLISCVQNMEKEIKELNENINITTEERDDARRAYDELEGDVMNMENEIRKLKDKLSVLECSNIAIR